ncbi:hypothetical protein LG201_02170 [Methylobacillus gramineus]|uniref:hypothetical protein n=1 Tax=Methylobacillus gramineus TaxID=755169 RepID=UPI001D001665|nr:hypothetical protein [Methylobacillus gramineus]MCB5184007.1 hypothetical protein [Methylobacillus gramineus]
MCEPATMGYIATALAAGGTYMNMQATEDAADRQQKIINNAAAETADKNNQKANKVETFAEDIYNPATRDQSYEQAATENESSLVDALLRANGGSDGAIRKSAEGNLSSDYTRAKAASTALATDDILKRAKLMGRQNAGGLMYNNELLKRGQLNSEVAGIQSSINRTNNSAGAALSGVRNNGSLAGGLLAGLGSYGSSMMGTKQEEWDSAMNAMNK